MVSNKELAIYGLIIVILGGAYSLWSSYPTIHPMVQGIEEVVPLKLVNGQQSYIQIKNDGPVSVIVTVNFYSDGSIKFKKDTGQITDNFQVHYSVSPNKPTNFRFTPIMNNSLTNATLIIKYKSVIENSLVDIPPRNSKGGWIAFYRKTTQYETWGLNYSQLMPNIN